MVANHIVYIRNVRPITSTRFELTKRVDVKFGKAIKSVCDIACSNMYKMTSFRAIICQNYSWKRCTRSVALPFSFF